MRRPSRSAVAASAAVLASVLLGVLTLAAPARAAAPKQGQLSVPNLSTTVSLSGEFDLPGTVTNTYPQSARLYPNQTDPVLSIVSVSAGAATVTSKTSPAKVTTFDISYVAPAASSAVEPVRQATITYRAKLTYTTHANTRNAMTYTVTSEPATVSVTLTPVRADPPGVTVLTPSGAAAGSTAVVAGGLLNPDEFATATTRPASTAPFAETVQVTARSLTCARSVTAQTRYLGQGQTATFGLRADPGNWTLTAHSLTTGETTTVPFTVPLIGTGKYCTLPTSVLGLTISRATGGSGSGPAYVAPYAGTANSFQGPSNNSTFTKSDSGFSADAKNDVNPDYDAAQAAQGVTGCHRVGNGASTTFVGCDDVANTAATAAPDDGSALTGTPAIIGYVVLFLLALALLVGLARRARTS